MRHSTLFTLLFILTIGIITLQTNATTQSGAVNGDILSGTILKSASGEIVKTSTGNVLGINDLNLGWKLSQQQFVMLSVWSECTNIKSPDGYELFIPTRSKIEWNAFKAGAPQVGAVFSDCLKNYCSETKPDFPNIGTLTTGTPEFINQNWVYNKDPGNCTYTCLGGYSGSGCSVPPSSCSTTLPGCNGKTCALTYNPTSANQNWKKDSSSCGFTCIGGYRGADCTTPPPPTCTSFTYAVNGDCQPNGRQSIYPITASPAGCAGGSPASSQSCTYVPPPQPGICSITTPEEKWIMDMKYSPILYCDTSKSGLPTNSYVVGSSITTYPDKFTWTCNGTSGGSNTSCSIPRKYRVKFDGTANGGDGGNYPTSYGVVYNNPPPPSTTPFPSNPWKSTPSSVFVGWFTSPTGGTQITPESFRSTPITTDTTYYAQYVPAYTVTFDGNGGASNSSRRVGENMAIGELPVVSVWGNWGWEFDGWYTQKAGGTKITSSTIVTGNVTYYARWLITVSFDSNGGTTSGVSSIKVGYGMPVGFLPNVSKSGWVFHGWYNGDSHTTGPSSMGVQYTTATPVLGDTKLYAVYMYTFPYNGYTYMVTPSNCGHPYLNDCNGFTGLASEGKSFIFKTSNTPDPGAMSESDGAANTASMNDANHPWAKYCSDLVLNGYSDWFLPSKNEMAQLHARQKIIGGLSSAYTVTSTTLDDSKVWYLRADIPATSQTYFAVTEKSNSAMNNTMQSRCIRKY